MIGLTRKQQAIMDYISRYTAEHGVSPTLPEIAEYLGYSDVKPVEYGVNSLERKGRIHRIPHKNRGIELGPLPVVKLNPEIHRLARDYAEVNSIPLETAVNELLRGTLDAA